MAKTKKDKKSVLIKEIVQEMPIELEQTGPMEYLTPGDLLKCETLSRDILNHKLTMNLEEQNLRNMLLEIELLKNRAEKQKTVLIEKSKLYENSKRAYNSYVGEMWPRYGIDPTQSSLGYDDQTGKIVK